MKIQQLYLLTIRLHLLMIHLETILRNRGPLVIFLAQLRPEAMYSKQLWTLCLVQIEDIMNHAMNNNPTLINSTGLRRIQHPWTAHPNTLYHQVLTQPISSNFSHIPHLHYHTGTIPHLVQNIYSPGTTRAASHFTVPIYQENLSPSARTASEKKISFRRSSSSGPISLIYFVVLIALICSLIKW